MQRRALFAAAALLAAAPLAAQETADTTQVHVVRPGDTLWDLSQRYLGNPYQWPEIFRLNRDRIENPNWIFPRELLLIPGVARDVTAAPVAVAERHGRTVFTQTEAPRSAGPTFEGAEAMPFPVVDRGEFLAAGVLVAEGELRPVGRLAAPLAPTVIQVEIPSQIRVNERVYMRVAEGATVRAGERLHLVREDRRVRGYGSVIEPTGIAVVEAVERGTATLLVEQLFDAVEVGDYAVPLPEYRVAAGVTPRPQTGRDGRIVAWEDPQPVHASHDIAFLDLGERDGVAVGDEYVAVIPPAEERWGYRPEIVVARLQVVRVAGRTSSVRVLEMDHPALEAGLVVRQVAKMP